MTQNDPTPQHELIISSTNSSAVPGSVDQAADIPPAMAYLASLRSARSRAVMRDDLAQIAALVMGLDPDSVTADERRALVNEVAWWKLDITHTTAIQTVLTARYASHNTVNRMLSALRGVLKWCWRQDRMSAEAYHRARDVSAIRGSTLPTGRDLGSGEIGALFDVCAADPSPAGARDAALLACADAGLRRSEIAGLDLVDYEQEHRRLKVQGKGNKERYVPLNDGQTRALEDWRAVRGTEPGALLWPVNKGGKLTNRKLSSQAIYNALQKRGKEAGVDDFSPHDFRRTLVGDLLDAGADIATVQKIMGHAAPTTTARYDRRPEQAKQKAANLRHTPYKGRKQNPPE